MQSDRRGGADCPSAVAHRNRIWQVHREWPLAEHCLAGLQRAENNFLVTRHLHGHQDEIDIGVMHQLLRRVEVVRRSIQFRGRLCGVTLMMTDYGKAELGQLTQSG